MKLRLQGNSIRLRLNRNDVAEFAQAGRIQDTVDFGQGAFFTYALDISKAGEARASLEGTTLRITLPEQAAQEWARSERVGISARDQQLSILVEKDFQCLHEPDPDAYPNPDVAHH
ncbi:MAG: hypothetical protein M3Z32_08245 [Acidobacteriota bacterium]|nr:hypothetical protein [Acidobacteriota bacterium]